MIRIGVIRFDRDGSVKTSHSLFCKIQLLQRIATVVVCRSIVLIHLYRLANQRHGKSWILTLKRNYAR